MFLRIKKSFALIAESAGSRNLYVIHRSSHGKSINGHDLVSLK